MNQALVDRIANLTLETDFVEDVRVFLATFQDNINIDAKNAFSRYFIYGSNTAPLERLEAILGSGALTRAVEQGIVVADADVGYLPFGFIQLGANTYLRESRWFYEHRNLFSIVPAHINEFVKQQIQYLDKLTTKKRPARLLEMGCGTGLVALELADKVGECRGVDIYPRNLVFARANLQLSGRSNVFFIHSDLFANVEQAHDLIVFYPWAPAEDSLDLVGRFLEHAPDALTPEGTIVLITGSDSQPGEQMVLDTITSACASRGLRATREYAVSYFMARGSRSIGTISMYVLGRRKSTPNGTRPPLVRTTLSRGYAEYLTRKAVAAFLGLR